MKKYIYISMIASLVMLCVPTSAKAEINGAGTLNMRADYGVQGKKGTKDIYRDKKVSDDSKVGSEKNEARLFGGALENRREMLRKNLTMITARIEAGISRLEQIITRLESRNTKLASEGIKTTVSAGFIAQAKVELAGAKADIASLPETFNQVKEESASRTAVTMSADVKLTLEKNTGTLTKIRTILKSAKNHLEAARNFLIKAVQATKAVTPQVSNEIKTEINTD